MMEKAGDAETPSATTVSPQCPRGIPGSVTAWNPGLGAAENEL